MSSELDKYSEEGEKINYELNLGKKKFIRSILKNKELIKKNGGKIKIKSLPYGFRFLQNILYNIKKYTKYFLNRIILLIIRNKR